MQSPWLYNSPGVKIHPGGATIKIVKIIVYVATFAVVIAIAVAIAALSLSVAPAAAKSTFLGKVAIILGGFAVTGGVIYLAERLQGTYRQRVKTLRGLDSLETGQRYLDGWTLTYNLFREHESLGFDTPAQRARVNAPFTEWEDVVLSRDGLIPPPRRDLPELKPQAVIKRLKRRENPDRPPDKPAKAAASNGRRSLKRKQPQAPKQARVAPPTPAIPVKGRRRVIAPRSGIRGKRIRAV